MEDLIRYYFMHACMGQGRRMDGYGEVGEAGGGSKHRKTIFLKNISDSCLDSRDNITNMQLVKCYTIVIYHSHYFDTV